MDTKTAFIVFDLFMAIIFAVIGFLFYNSDGKAVKYLTGYNMKFKDDRKQYDETKMCRDYGKRIMCWAIPFVIGIFIDSKYTGKGTPAAIILWIVLFVYFIVMRYKTEN